MAQSPQAERCLRHSNQSSRPDSFQSGAWASCLQFSVAGNLPAPGPLLIVRKFLQKASLMKLLLHGLIYFFPLAYTD